MNKSIRPVFYLLIGAGIYFAMGADKNPEVLDEFHRYAPFALVFIVVLLMIARRMKSKNENKE